MEDGCCAEIQWSSFIWLQASSKSLTHLDTCVWQKKRQRAFQKRGHFKSQELQFCGQGLFRRISVHTPYVGYSRENTLIIYVFIQNQSDLVSGLGKLKACTHSRPMCLFKYMWGVWWGVRKSPEYFLQTSNNMLQLRGKKIHISCQMGIKQRFRSVCVYVCICVCVCVQV